MAFRHQPRAPTHTPELSLSDSEESENEMTEREETDQTLRKMHHYIITEGGDDLPTTYMEKVQHMNRNAMQEIIKYNFDHDPKLYRRVKQKIDHVLREFEDAADLDTSISDYEMLPKRYTAAAEKTPTQMDADIIKSGPLSARPSVPSSVKSESEKIYVYEGPGSQPEYWHKKFPASLPFPETIRMADWESLRIQYDLATTGDLENKEPVTSIGVSFNDPLLEHHDKSAQYESGSRFKLPSTLSSYIDLVVTQCTLNELHAAVEVFNQGDEESNENGEFRYAPRVFLPKLEVGSQVTSPDFVDQVRSAVNTSPTKFPSSSSNIEPTPPAGRSLLNSDEELPPRVDSQSYINKNYSKTTTIGPASHTDLASPPAIRRTRAATKASTQYSAQTQSPPAHPEATQPHKTTVKTAPAKKSQGCSRINPVAKITTRHYQSNSGGTKRRRVSEEADSESPANDGPEEEVEIEELQPRRKKTKMSARDLSMEDMEPLTPIEIEDPEIHDATPALTPASSSSVVSSPPVRKAKAAGKQKRLIRTKNDYAERVTQEQYTELMAMRHTPLPATGHESVPKGSTRSGKQRAV